MSEEDDLIDRMTEAKRRLDENAEKTLRKIYYDQLSREEQEDRVKELEQPCKSDSTCKTSVIE